jgi:protein-disulfide isomerase
MKNLVFLTVGLALAACQPDTRNLERKIDALDKKLDALAAKGLGGGAGAAPQRPQRPEPDRAKTYSVPVDNDAFDGPADAKVTVVKAYDYACPYCEKVRPTMDELRKKYGNDLRVVSKQLVVHPKNAMAGALAFCAANEQGKAKQMDALIWDKGFKVRQLDNSDVAPAAGDEAGQPQKCWDTAAGCPLVVGYAQELGLNLDRFKADMKGKCMQVVQKDMKDLQALGVAATPAFFSDGRFVSGAVPIENFSAVIDEELKKANAQIQNGTPAAEYYKQFVVEKGQKSLTGA